MTTKSRQPCHSDPAVAGEESQIIFGDCENKNNSHRCFASLNVTLCLRASVLSQAKQSCKAAPKTFGARPGFQSRIISSVVHGRSYNFGCCSQSSLRSSHLGLVRSISAIFLLRRQPFSLFSQAIASFTSRKCSIQTSRVK